MEWISGRQPDVLVTPDVQVRFACWFDRKKKTREDEITDDTAYLSV